MQCGNRWHKLVAKGKVSIDEVEHLSSMSYYAPDLCYDYDDDVEKAFRWQLRKISRKNKVWPPKMV